MHAGKDDLLIKGSLSDTDIDAAKEIFESVSSTEVIQSKRRASNFSTCTNAGLLLFLQEPGSKTKRRGRRNMRFRRVIATGKPVKNFLKVKSCYYPSCDDQKLNRHYSKPSSNVKS